jgi:hypothetical protein
LAIISILVAAILFYLRRKRSEAASADSDVGANQPMLNDGTVTTVTQPSPAPQLMMKLYVCALMSHAVPSGAIFLLFHTPRTRMTQLRSRDTKAVHNIRTSLPFLKHLRHRKPDPEAR